MPGPLAITGATVEVHPDGDDVTTFEKATVRVRAARLTVSNRGGVLLDYPAISTQRDGRRAWRITYEGGYLVVTKDCGCGR